MIQNRKSLLFLLSILIPQTPIASNQSDGSHTFEKDIHRTHDQVQILCNKQHQRINSGSDRLAHSVIQDLDGRLQFLSSRIEQVSRFLNQPERAIASRRDAEYRKRLAALKEELGIEQEKLVYFRDKRKPSKVLIAQVERVRGAREKLRQLEQEHEATSPTRHPEVVDSIAASAMKDLKHLVTTSHKLQKLRDKAGYCQWVAQGRPGTLYDVSGTGSETMNPMLKAIEQKRIQEIQGTGSQKTEI